MLAKAFSPHAGKKSSGRDQTRWAACSQIERPCFMEGCYLRFSGPILSCSFLPDLRFITPPQVRKKSPRCSQTGSCSKAWP